MSKEYIAAAFLIAAGMYLVFFYGKQNDAIDEVAKEEKQVQLNEEVKEEEKKESRKVVISKANVSKLKIPSNFPQEIDIYFGSQTGNAEKFSHILEEEGQDLGVICKVIDMEDFDQEELSQSELSIFVVATHGEGDPTDNALRMHSWIKKTAKNKENIPLKNLKYTVFGLGDREYENFCEMGKFFDKKLEELGAFRVYDKFLGDTSGDLEGEFAEWKAKLWSALIDHYEAINTAKTTRERVAPAKKSKYPLKIIEAGDQNTTYQIQPLCIRQYMSGKDVKIHSMRECRQTSKYGSCLEVIYSLKDEFSNDLKFKYETASNLAVFPENDDSDINRICKRLNLDKNLKFVFENEEGDKEVRKHPFPTPCTIEEAFRKYCDLRGPLDRNTFKNLSEFAIDESEKIELIRLSSNDTKEEIEAMKNNFTNIMDILERFPSINMTGDVFFQFVPKMMPRYYTIASSSKLSPDKVRIAISLTVHENSNGTRFKGLTSDYFNRVFRNHFKEEYKESVSSRIFFKESLFKIPDSTKTPLIMVGPGTGVVPFIAFSEEREFLKAQDPSIELGESHLFFGCKGKDDDYIYRNELAKFKKDGIITHLYEAFSRDQKTKVYVQDLMLENKDQLKDLIINKNAYIFMCGSMDMGKAVEKLLEETIAQDPEVWKKLKDEKRFAKELWSA